MVEVNPVTNNPVKKEQARNNTSVGGNGRSLGNILFYTSGLVLLFVAYPLVIFLRHFNKTPLSASTIVLSYVLTLFIYVAAGVIITIIKKKKKTDNKANKVQAVGDIPFGSYAEARAVLLNFLFEQFGVNPNNPGNVLMEGTENVGTNYGKKSAIIKILVEDINSKKRFFGAMNMHKPILRIGLENATELEMDRAINGLADSKIEQEVIRRTVSNQMTGNVASEEISKPVDVPLHDKAEDEGDED
jgi:hypothetical protein